MIIETEADVTRAVLAEAERAADPRFRRILQSAVRHLHDFVRDSELTEAEFRQICGVIAKLGQLTTPSHNEVVLAAGSLGVSALVCLLNDKPEPGHGTTANLMGPFWRQGLGPARARSGRQRPLVFARSSFRDLRRRRQPARRADHRQDSRRAAAACGSASSRSWRVSPPPSFPTRSFPCASIEG